MNKILIVDATATDYGVMSSLLMQAGYDPVSAECIEAGKIEAASMLSVTSGCHLRLLCRKHPNQADYYLTKKSQESFLRFFVVVWQHRLELFLACVGG